MPPMPPELVWAMRICQYLSDQMKQDQAAGFAPVWNNKEMVRNTLGMTEEEFDAGVQCAVDHGWLLVRDVDYRQ